MTIITVYIHQNLVASLLNYPIFICATSLVIILKLQRNENSERFFVFLTALHFLFSLYDLWVALIFNRYFMINAVFELGLMFSCAHMWVYLNWKRQYLASLNSIEERPEGALVELDNLPRYEIVTPPPPFPVNDDSLP